jgi:hypothetical protein
MNTVSLSFMIGTVPIRIEDEGDRTQRLVLEQTDEINARQRNSAITNGRYAITEAFRDSRPAERRMS